MLHVSLRKIGVAVLVVAVTIAVAFILGTQAGNKVAEWQYRENRDKTTKLMLSDMRTLEIGDKLPDHTFEDLEGAEIRLSDLVSGRTIICFFEIGCGTCIVELEAMQAALEDSLRRHVVLISPDDRLDLREARAAYDIQAPILWDQHSFYAQNLKIPARPFNVVIDSSLTIEWIIAGKLSESELRKFLQNYISVAQGRLYKSERSIDYETETTFYRGGSFRGSVCSCLGFHAGGEFGPRIRTVLHRL